VSLLRWRQQDAGMGRTWSSTGISQAGHPGLYDLQTPEDRQSALVLVLGGRAACLDENEHEHEQE
jgi:hypothetical protein